MAEEFEIINRLTTRARSALVNSQKLAQELKHQEIGPVHLLCGIVEVPSAFANEVILKRKIDPAAVRQRLQQMTLPSISRDALHPRVSSELQDVLERAAIAAQKNGYAFIGTEHLLYALIGKNGPGKTLVAEFGLEIPELVKNLEGVFEHFSHFGEMLPSDEELALEETGDALTRPRSQALEYFASDLTAKAAGGKIDPLVGRKKELERLISILNRRNKNNPLLIGEPGVGKTAIVEGFALAIARQQVPDNLLDKKVLHLDLASVVAGSMFRGEFENRLKQIIEEARANPNIILFIDELHTVIGAGAATGSLDAANILKPVLARGEIAVIGATTLADYKKHVENDPALERRFQPILIEEPSVDQTEKILLGLRPFYERHHRIAISGEAIRAACELSARYISDRYLPDKALDLIDESASFLRGKSNKTAAVKNLKTLERKIAHLEADKDNAILEQEFDRAAKLQLMLDGYKKILEQTRPQLPGTAEKSRPRLLTEHIAATVAQATKIPVSKLLQKTTHKIANLERELKKHIIGQDEVIANIASSLKRAQTGVSSPTRPQGTFLFLGPSGVGKTETAKVLARVIFGSEKDLIRVDMSEFMERHNVSRLIGAPAGYVGYEEGGKLTESVKRKPYAVVLFDEIEKAHPDVFNILLQIFEEGELTDAAGKKTNFKNTILILTSNIGSADLNQYALGFTDETKKNKSSPLPDYEKIKGKIFEALNQRLSAELINRIDHIAVFRPLNLDTLKTIAKLELSKLDGRLMETGVKISYPPSLVDFLVKNSFDPKAGARKIRKVVADVLENRISNYLIRHAARPARLGFQAQKGKGFPFKIRAA
ncbi:MAG: ATP-dependent Clp protease ATP-binding subunit [Candidatus Doudnabacteria bacterium]|nr:ATP-dependent Clp protease ATP-binding subunit [Candidatus Doudnabacteria bacterium]